MNLRVPKSRPEGRLYGTQHIVWRRVPEAVTQNRCVTHVRPAPSEEVHGPAASKGRHVGIS
jgi:hypothetical protein